jgi:hypothetical protein
MRRAPVLAALAGLLLVAADRDPLAGRVAGPPQRCIAHSSSANDGPTIVDANTILYRQGTRLYRTGLRDACPGLRPFTTLIVDVYAGQLCANDHFRVLQPGTTLPSAICRFGEFTPYTKGK